MRIRNTNSTLNSRKSDKTREIALGPNGHSGTQPFSNDKCLSPPVVSAGDHVSAGVVESVEDVNTAYLKPDFLDVITMSKRDPICPSPLAMLAKTCQNIGQMLEAGPRSSQPSLFSTIERHTYASAAASGRNTPPSKIPRIKFNASSTEPRVAQNGKRPGRLKSTKVEGSAATQAKVTEFGSVALTSGMRESPECRNVSLRMEHSTSHKPAFSYSYPDPSVECWQRLRPFQSCSNTCKEDTENLGESKPTTSNALAQLARLSSKFVSPEPLKPTGKQMDKTETKGREVCREPQHLQAGKKRLRSSNASATMTQCTELRVPVLSRQLTECGLPSCPHLKYSDSVGFSGKPITCAYPLDSISASEHSVYDSHSSDLGDFWTHLFKQLQQPANKCNEKESFQQNVFLYNLARSFLDFFYTKLPITTHKSGADSYLPHPHTVESEPQMEENSANNEVFPSHPQQINEAAHWYRTHSPSEPPQSSEQTIQVSQCTLCGHTFSTITELYYHLYIHLLTRCREPNAYDRLIPSQDDPGADRPKHCDYRLLTDNFLVTENSAAFHDTKPSIDNSWTSIINLFNTVSKGSWPDTERPSAAHANEPKFSNLLNPNFDNGLHLKQYLPTHMENGTYFQLSKDSSSQRSSNLSVGYASPVTYPNLEHINAAVSFSNAFTWPNPIANATVPHVTLFPKV